MSRFFYQALYFELIHLNQTWVIAISEFYTTFQNAPLSARHEENKTLTEKITDKEIIRKKQSNIIKK